MTFATEKEKQASNRFVLVRIEPSRDLTADLSAEGGGVYSVALNVKPRLVQQSGSIFSEASLPLSSNGTYGWDGTTFYIKTATAPNYATGVVVCNYWILVTNKDAIYFNPDPDTLLLPAELWDSRLSSAPEVNMSVENLRSGNITISASSIEIITTDGFIEDRLTKNDSYFNKPVTVWQCINSTSNIRKIFTGKSTSVSISSGIASIEVLDSLNTLTSPCYMGDLSGEVLLNTTNFPNVDPKHIGAAIPYLLCDYTPHDFTPKLAAGGTGNYYVTARDISVFYEARCISYSKTISTSNNRTWSLCRSKAFKKQSFGSINSVIGSSTNHISVNFASYSNLYVGQPISWVESSVTYYGHIGFVGLSGGYNVFIRLTGTTGVITTSSVFNAGYCLSVFVKTTDSVSSTPEIAGVSEVLYEGRDYYVSEGTTSGGNKTLSITFQTVMEANVNAYHSHFNTSSQFANRALNPDYDNVYFYVHTDFNLNHSKVAQLLIESSGLSVDATSFAAAESALSLNCKFSIPHYGEQNLGSYADYLQQLMFCAVSFLSIGEDNEVEYYLLTAPDPSTTADADRLDASNSYNMSQNVDYQDIYWIVRGKNEMLSNNQLTNLFDVSTISKDTTGYNNLAYYLHGVDRELNFKDVTDGIASTIDYITDLAVSPVSRYTLSTATKSLGEPIGRDFYLVRKVSTPVKGKVISSSSGAAQSTIIIDDLSKLTRA